nr:helix-hairpin-helix domain-containing protein [bacterium]
MAHIIIPHTPTAEESIAQMQQDALYDVAEAPRMVSSQSLQALSSGICSRPAPPTVPKIFLSNNCIFNCAYCACRCTVDKPRYSHTPRALALLAQAQARKNGRGVFITSSIYQNADYTQELIIETLRVLRQELHYPGYIHAKVMPGANAALIAQTGRYADRLSVNIEVASSSGYAHIAKQKNKQNILTPMKAISQLIAEHQGHRAKGSPRFATSQTTQLMAGSTGESDYTILNLSRALYQKYGLSRVYYTAFQYKTQAVGYHLPPVSTPAWRMARLYQADRLMQLYGFSPDELLTDAAPNLRPDLDPKTAWALRNINLFPVDINRADYQTLLRIPGIGEVSAKRILAARRIYPLSHDTLRQIGVPLARSRFFITCSGRYHGGMALEHPDYLAAHLGTGPVQLSCL